MVGVSGMDSNRMDVTAPMSTIGSRTSIAFHCLVPLGRKILQTNMVGVKHMSAMPITHTRNAPIAIIVSMIHLNGWFSYIKHDKMLFVKFCVNGTDFVI